MFVRRITLAFAAIAAFALAGCASTPTQQAPYRHLLGEYDISTVAMLDAHNQKLSTKQLIRAAVEQKFAEEGPAFLKKHPDMTKQDLMKMVNVFINAKLRDHDPLKHMFTGVKRMLTKDLDGKPFLTLNDTSIIGIKPLFVPDAHGKKGQDDLVTVTDTGYRLQTTQGVRTLLANGTYKGKPAHLQLYLLKDGRVFLDMLPFIKDKLGKKSHNLMSFGVDKIGVFLTRRG